MALLQSITWPDVALGAVAAGLVGWVMWLILHDDRGSDHE